MIGGKPINSGSSIGSGSSLGSSGLGSSGQNFDREPSRPSTSNHRPGSSSGGEYESGSSNHRPSSSSNRPVGSGSSSSGSNYNPSSSSGRPSSSGGYPSSSGSGVYPGGTDERPYPSGSNNRPHRPSGSGSGGYPESSSNRPVSGVYPSGSSGSGGYPSSGSSGGYPSSGSGGSSNRPTVGGVYPLGTGSGGYPGSSGSSGLGSGSSGGGYPSSSGSGTYPQSGSHGSGSSLGGSNSGGYPHGSGGHGSSGNGNGNGYPQGSGSGSYPGSSNGNGRPITPQGSGRWNLTSIIPSPSESSSSSSGGGYPQGSGGRPHRPGGSSGISSAGLGGGESFGELDPAVTFTKLYPETCGISQTTKIVGGVETDPKKWQWMAALIKPRSNSADKFCGGALITDGHVLTAAHCLTKVTPNDIMVRLGSYDFGNSADPQSVDHKIRAFKIHPEYDERTQANDIAILVLEKKVSLNEDLRPVCLPQERRDYKESIGTVIGFGSTTYGGRGSSKLREVSLPIWDNQQCRGVYGERLVHPTHLCAGTREGGKDSCQGDSGGPFMVQGPSKRWMMVGVVSWGQKCGEPNFPGVYTRVTEYNNWILDNVRDQGNQGSGSMFGQIFSG